MVQSHVVNNIYRYHPLFSYFSRDLSSYHLIYQDQLLYKKSLALCLIAGLLIGSLNGCSTSKNETPASSDITQPSSDISQPSSGFSLSSFKTADLEGTTVTQDVFKDYDITMVNVWTTWCQYCVEEMPELEKVYRNLPENSNLITVCMDAEEEEEEAKRLVKETGITFQVLTGNEDLHKIMDKNLSGFPTIFCTGSPAERSRFLQNWTAGSVI